MCRFCGKVIKLDMGRHVANYHLIWPSSGAARYLGAPSGKIHPWIVWSIYVRHMLCHLKLRRPTWGSAFPQWDYSPGNVARCLETKRIRHFNRCFFVQWAFVRVYGGGSGHVSLRWSYMTKLWAFTVQAEADGRWARHKESAQPDAVCPASVQPWDIRRQL